MSHIKPDPPFCPDHGARGNRRTCLKCNSLYMRHYLKTMRRERPAKTILERARKRSRRHGVAYSLRRQDISVPAHCPVLGLPLVVGEARSAASPSLDRIDPNLGYQPGNVRVISDQANRLKGNRTLGEVQLLSRTGAARRRADYAAVAAYMEREALLAEVRQKATNVSSPNNPWLLVAEFLDKKFRQYPVPYTPLPPDLDRALEDGGAGSEG